MRRLMRVYTTKYKLR